MTMLSKRVFPSFLPVAPGALVLLDSICVVNQLTIDRIDVFLQQHPVPLPLHVGHADVEVDFLLREERVFHIRLNTPQQKRSQHFV